MKKIFLLLYCFVITFLPTKGQTYKKFDCELFSLEYPSTFKQNKIYNAPHMALKLESENYFLMVSYWDYGISNDVSVWDDGIYENYKNDIVENSVNVSITKEMVQTKGALKQCLKIKSNIQAKEKGYNLNAKMLYYIMIHDGYLFVITFLSEGIYTKASSTAYPDRIIKGLKFKDTKYSPSPSVEIKEPANDVIVNWQEYSFNKICSFKIPPSLELRDNSSIMGKIMNSGVNNLREIIIPERNPDFEIKFQPKGMNSDNLDTVRIANSRYARVIISCERNDEITENDIKLLSESEFNEYDKIMKEDMKNELKHLKQDLDFVWYPSRKELIGGKYAIARSYERSGTKGKVIVKQYLFALEKMTLNFTISYRYSERDFWKNDLDIINKTIKFYNQ